MKLYGHEDSGHAYKVALTLTLSQIPYDYEWVDIWASCATRPQAFRENSPWCEVPLLMIGDQPFIQSGAILMKLTEDFDALGGRANAFDRAREWIIWEANRIGMSLPQLIQAQKTPEDFSAGSLDFLKERFDLDQERLASVLDEQPYLCGSDPSIADIAVFGYVSKAPACDIPLRSSIYSWLERIKNLPHFQTAQTLLALKRF